MPRPAPIGPATGSATAPRALERRAARALVSALLVAMTPTGMVADAAGSPDIPRGGTASATDAPLARNASAGGAAAGGATAEGATAGIATAGGATEAVTAGGATEAVTAATTAEGRTRRSTTVSVAGSTIARREPNELVVPATLDRPPAGRRRSGREVIAIADRVDEVRAVRRRHGRTTPRAFLKGTERWQVSYYAKPERRGRAEREVAQVVVDDRTGRVEEAWTGHHVAWTMARGYPGAFGRKVNAPYIWIGLCVLFVLPFLRRPLRLLHLDLAVLLAFSVSYAFFNAAAIDVSVPMAYPLLLYLLFRMLGVAIVRGRARHGASAPLPPLRLLTPDGFLGLAVVFLIGFRVGLNITDSNVIDVGYAGVIGADRLTSGEDVWGTFPEDNLHGDTYGPVNYAAYVPFELVWPWRGTWDQLPAAHAAAMTFDLLCVLVLWLLGRRLRGPRLGLLLAYCWVAFPFTLLVSNSNANDTLVGLLVASALLVAGSPAGRGVFLALAALTKFAPLALGPVFATFHGRPWGTVGAADRAGWRSRVRPSLVTAIAVAITLAAILAPIALDGDLRMFYARTVGFQGGRGSPFSVWGLWELGELQRVAQVAVVALAVVVAFVPRRRDVVSLAALAAAVLIGLQLVVTHWFYLYLVWFLPLTFVALLARHADPPANGAKVP